jgi:flagellar hook-associated protein 1
MAPLSTFFGLQTSLRGLLAHQRSLDVTGHNVANASTTGYSRQEAVLNATDAQVIVAGAVNNGRGAQLGTGVEVQEYRRIRDGFLDIQYRAQAAMLGESDAKARSLEGVDLALAEPGENGIAFQLDKFWSAWATLADNPSSVPARQMLLERAKTVAASFSDFDRQLVSLQTNAAEELRSLMAYDPDLGIKGEVAAIATELAQTGYAIRDAVLTGQAPNDLMDHRDQLLDRLSQLGTVSVQQHTDGGITVFFAGRGEPLVDDRLADDPLTAADDRVSWDPDEALVNAGGKLGALHDLSRAGGILDTYRTDLATIVNTFQSAVNDAHDDGVRNLRFFDYDPALRAQGLRVVATVGTIDPGTTGTAESNQVALQIAAMRGGAVDDAYATFVSRIGAEVNQNLRTLSNAEVLVNAVEDRRQAASGVSLDEEMTNLIRFQRGYQASARTMSTLDEMLDVLINRTGRVGL